MDWTTTLLPLATAFGLALLHSLWIGALIYCVVRTVLPFLPSPGARHNLAYLALLGLGGSFLASLFFLYEPIAECAEEAVATGLFIVTPTLPETATPLEIFIANAQASAPWLSAAYVLGLLPATLLLVRDQKRSWSLRHRGTLELPAAWRTQFRRELNRYPALARIRCHLSERAGEVMTLGWWSPVIVFPVALVNELTPEMARTILLHEIAHLRHYDHILNYPQQLLRTLFFFHPAAHALCHIIDREREHRCDDWVAVRCDDRRTYATALVTVARSSLQAQNTLAMSATKTPFTTRIQRLFGGDNPRRDGQYALSLLMIVFLAAAQTGFAQLGADAGAADCPEEPPLATTTEAPTPMAVADLSTVALVAEMESRTTTTVATNLMEAPRVDAVDCPDCGDDGPPQPPANNDARAQEMYRKALNRYAQSHAHHAGPVIITGTATLAKTLDCSTTKVTGRLATSEKTIRLVGAPGIIARTDRSLDYVSSPAIVSGQRVTGVASSPVIIDRKATQGTATVLPQLASKIAVRRVIDTVPKPSTLEINKPDRTITIKTNEDGKKTGTIKVHGSIDRSNIAYFVDGKRKKEGALDKLKPEEIESISVVKGKDKLQELNIDGKYEGAVMILTKKGAKKLSGEAKGKGSLRIKTSELTEGNPLYVIDGKLQERADISEIDPGEVAEVSVLKGASATALYGERGANGVVLIRTKKGAVKIKKKEN